MNDIEIETIAEVCHEVNRAYCQALGDHSVDPWNTAPKYQRDSCKAGVQFHLDNPDALPMDAHSNWLRDKEVDGWAYGPTKNTKEKLHPCMVPFADLPKAQQIKDYLFRGVVHALRH